jgi:hypothetical protein
MYAISVAQPWASLIVLGAKKAMNDPSNRPLHYRGPVAIHASGRAPKRHAWAIFEEDATQRALKKLPYRWVRDVHTRSWLLKLPTNCIVGIADIDGCYPVDDRPPRVEQQIQKYSDAMKGLYTLTFAHARPTRIVPCHGNFGLFKLPPDLEKALHLTRCRRPHQHKIGT